jgi:hypothetical protein
MNLREVIKHLQKLQSEEGGDTKVYVNGECGEQVEATPELFILQLTKTHKVYLRIGG